MCNRGGLPKTAENRRKNGGGSGADQSARGQEK